MKTMPIIQYLVKVHQKDQIDFLKPYGTIKHVARLRNLIVFESDLELKALSVIQAHPNVISIRESETLRLVADNTIDE